MQGVMDLQLFSTADPHTAPGCQLQAWSTAQHSVITSCSLSCLVPLFQLPPAAGLLGSAEAAQRLHWSSINIECDVQGLNLLVPQDRTQAGWHTLHPISGTLL